MKQPVIYVSRTKIIATIGPNSSDVATLRAMSEAGMTVARFNMSHGNHEDHARLMANARAAAKAAKRPLALLLDLSGPKIRIGDFTTETVTLVEGEPFTLTTVPCNGTRERVWVNYKKLPREVTEGTLIFLNDGKLSLRVTRINDTELETIVVNGGEIRGRRGVNVPDGALTIPSLTPKDKKDLAFGLSQGVDFVTLSFVRTANDIHALRRLIGTNHDVAIVAKIETKSALDNIEDIIDATDIVMVARGDLAIETPATRVPLIQKRIIRKANRAGKPVITATHMLDSMRLSVTPTRAEVNDVANAVLDGTDAVMLSDETAIGNHPAKAVAIMARIAHTTENDELFAERIPISYGAPETVCDATSESIYTVAKSLQAKAIVAFSESGYTGRMVARHRPRMPVLVLTPHRTTYMRSLVTFGCEPVLVSKVKHLSEARSLAVTALRARGYVQGDVFVLGAGIPFGAPGATNLMLTETLP